MACYSIQHYLLLIIFCCISVAVPKVCRPFRTEFNLIGQASLNSVQRDHSQYTYKWGLCESSTVCYNDPEPLGCFAQGRDTPFCQQVLLPGSPQEIQPEFWIYSPELGSGVNQTVDFLDHNLNKTLSALEYNSGRDLWVLVHGFGDDWPKEWMFPMKDALIEKGHNVLICRWTKGSKGPDYLKAAANTRIMGAMVARIVTVMTHINDVTLPTTTIVGFSLGAHVAGFAGAILGQNLKKIIGLDPAGPLFAGEEPAAALDASDAGFVQCLHTNGEALECGGAGTMQQMGHIDFYANGGEVQPPCPPGVPQAVDDIFHLNFTAIMGTLSCSHCRAPYLFTNSIMQAGLPQPACKFYSYKCHSDEDWHKGNCFSMDAGRPVAGYETEVGTPYSGMYMFGTRPGNNTVLPYCGSVFKIRLVSDKTAKGQIDIQLHFEDGYTSDTFEFQSISDNLPGESPTAHIMVTAYKVQKPSHITLTYHRYTSWVFSDGSDSFKLTDIAVIDNRQTPLYGNGEIEMKDKIPVTVSLNDNTISIH